MSTIPTNQTIDRPKPNQSEKLKTVQGLLKQMEAQIKMALPQHLTTEKMIRLCTTEFSKNPLLLECTQISLLGAVMQASQLGLTPGGILGECYFLPFKNAKKGVYECQFIVGYRGLVSLANRSGQVKRFQARAVYQGDVFDYEYGLDEFLKHKPSEEETGEITHVYAVLELTNGSKIFEVMTRKAIEFVRAKSQGKNNNVWVDYFDEMAKKTVIRRLAKLAPLSPEFSMANGLNEQVEQLGLPQKLETNLINLDIPELQEQLEENLNQDTQIAQTEIQEEAKQTASDKASAAGTETMKLFDEKKTSTTKPPTPKTPV